MATLFEPMPMRLCAGCTGWTPESERECVHCGLTREQAQELKRSKTWRGKLMSLWQRKPTAPEQLKRNGVDHAS